jgi:hypothetical protein
VQLKLEIWVGQKEIRGVRFHTGVEDIARAMTLYVERCFREYPWRELSRDGPEILREAQSLAAARALTWRPTRERICFIVDIAGIKLRAMSDAPDVQQLAADISCAVEWEFFAHCLDSDFDVFWVCQSSRD